MKFILIRHGEKQESDSTDFNIRHGVGLTTLGKKQIQETAKYIRNNFPLDEIHETVFSSYFPRAIQTAEIISKELGFTNIEKIEGLEECYAFNDYSTPKEIRDSWKKEAFKDYDWVSPQTGRSINMQIEIFTNSLKNIANHLETKNIALVCTHGGIIRALFYKLDPRNKPKIKDFWAVPIEFGSLNILDFTDGSFAPLEFNKIP